MTSSWTKSVSTACTDTVVRINNSFFLSLSLLLHTSPCPRTHPFTLQCGTDALQKTM